MSSSIDRYHRKRRALIDRLGGECVQCGSSEHLQFHHVDNGHDTHGVGGWQMLYRVEEDLRNGEEIVLMCRSCHELLHAEEPNHPLRCWVEVSP